MVDVIEGKWLGGHVDIASLTVIPASSQSEDSEDSNDESSDSENTNEDSSTDTESADSAA